MAYRVLIIEDNEQNMYLTRFLLESEGHTVLSANNGSDGIRVARDEKPDFVLLDIQLPEMSGYEVLAICRNDEQLRQLPIIVVTSYAMAGDRERSLEAGATGYLEKPINPDTFMQQIYDYIDHNASTKGK